MGIERAQEIIATRGLALSAADVERIEYELTQAPVDEVREAEPWLWEGVALIVNDPDYTGDAKVPK